MNLETQNKCLLSKWLFKLTNEDGIWQQLPPKKKPRIQNSYTSGEKARGLQNGEQIRFWEDKWLGNTAIKEQYPNLFNLVHRKHDMVQKVLNTNPLSVSFGRNLVGNNLRDWQDLVARVAFVHLVDRPDICVWSLHKSGQFSVHSMYTALLDETILPINKPLWKLKIPLKVKVFIWLLHCGVILTKDNLAKCNWHGNMQCCFCTNHETIAHLFFDCHLARLIWRIIHITFGLKKT